MAQSRITEKQLQAVVDRINRETGMPATPYRRDVCKRCNGTGKGEGAGFVNADDHASENWSREYPIGTCRQCSGNGKCIAPNAGSYHLSGAYCGVALHRMSMTEGCTGVSDVSRMGHVTKRDLYEFMQAFLSGFSAARGDA